MARGPAVNHCRRRKGREKKTKTRREGEKDFRPQLLNEAAVVLARKPRAPLSPWRGVYPLLAPALEQIHSQLESPQLAAPSAPRSMETGVIVTQTSRKGTS